jgi:hypothetical protein
LPTYETIPGRGIDEASSRSPSCRKRQAAVAEADERLQEAVEEPRRRRNTEGLAWLSTLGSEKQTSALSKDGGLNAKLLVHLLDLLSNPSPPLVRAFEAFPDGPPAPRKPVEPTRSSNRLGNGVVQRAVIKALAAAGEPMKVADIRAAAEQRIGQPVQNKSILWTLHMGVKGDRPRFERVSYGVYRLAR